MRPILATNWRFMLPALVPLLGLSASDGQAMSSAAPVRAAQAVAAESAPAPGWPKGASPVAALDLQVNAFASAFGRPRWLAVLPNGDVLVAESAPPGTTDRRPDVVVPSVDRITLLRDSDGDGVSDMRSPFVLGLNAPFGMSLVGTNFYVANTDAVMAYAYQRGQFSIYAAPRPIVDLPAGEPNYHWMKNMIASPDGSRLYVAVGSNSNVAEHGLEAEEGRAAIWEVLLRDGSHKLFATGLRNPTGLAFEPVTGALWATVDERQGGGDAVPDYLTRIQGGGFYGWPFSYLGGHVDNRIKPEQRRPDLVAKALVPDYELGPRTVPQGLVFAQGAKLGPDYAQGAFIGQQGSSKVVFVPFANGMPSGPARDILTGFVDAKGNVRGRPGSVAIAGDGSLLVLDDIGNTIWRVTRGKPTQQAKAAPRSPRSVTARVVRTAGRS